MAACTSGKSEVTAPQTTTTVPLPVDIKVSGTTNLKDGQEVRIHVTAKPGSSIFGFEARLCTAAASYRLDSDMRPTLTGKCVVNPLSPGSDDYQIVRATPPDQVADGAFRVGVGSETFPLETGRMVSITCGRQSACLVVLKVQFPNGFAFRTVPLQYA